MKNWTVRWSLLSLLLFTFSCLLLRERVKHQSVFGCRILSVVRYELKFVWHNNSSVNDDRILGALVFIKSAFDAFNLSHLF